MYISTKAAFLRNLGIAVVNGVITLVVLLIAPLGLAAVIINTALVTIVSFVVGMIADWAIAWVSDSVFSNRISPGQKQMIRQQKTKEIERRDD